MYLIYNYSYEAMEVHSPGTFWHSKFSLPADHNIHSSLWSTERNLAQNHLKIYARDGVNEEDTGHLWSEQGKYQSVVGKTNEKFAVPAPNCKTHFVANAWSDSEANIRFDSNIYRFINSMICHNMPHIPLRKMQASLSLQNWAPALAWYFREPASNDHNRQPGVVGMLMRNWDATFSAKNMAIEWLQNYKIKQKH